MGHTSSPVSEEIWLPLHWLRRVWLCLIVQACEQPGFPTTPPVIQASIHYTAAWGVGLTASAGIAGVIVTNILNGSFDQKNLGVSDAASVHPDANGINAPAG